MSKEEITISLSALSQSLIAKSNRVNSKTALCPSNKPKSKCDVCIANKTFKHKRRAEAFNYQLKELKK